MPVAPPTGFGRDTCALRVLLPFSVKALLHDTEFCCRVSLAASRQGVSPSRTKKLSRSRLLDDGVSPVLLRRKPFKMQSPLAMPDPGQPERPAGSFFLRIL